MDRVIPRKDQNGRDMLFLADTMNENSIVAWMPNGEPSELSLDFYHTTVPAGNSVAKKLAREYEKMFGETTYMMQRLPRIQLERPKLARLRQALMEQKKQFKEPAKEVSHHGRVMVREGDLWKVMERGNPIGYATDLEEALAIMKDEYAVC